MTSKERVLTACRHQEPDRIPLQGYFTPEVYGQLEAHFAPRPVEEALGIDLRGVNALYTGPVGPSPLATGEAEQYDAWGVGYSAQANPSGGVYMEASDLTLSRLTTLEDVERYPWPSVDSYDYAALPEACESVAEYAVCLGGAGMPDILNGVSRGRGMEQVIVDIANQDPVGVAIIDRRVEHYYEYCRRGLEAGGGRLDILALGEDCGTQLGRMFSPATFESFFVPRLQRFIDLAHEYGALAMLHSCGDTHDLLPTFIEMGLDILDAMQPEPAGMDPVRLKQQYGDRITFCGLISTQRTLPHGTPQDVRREVRERMETVGRGGGYILSPAHCIQPDTPRENVLALYAEALGVESL